MATTGEHESEHPALFSQPWRIFARKKVVGLGLVVGGLVAGIVAMLLLLQFSLTNENQTPTGWLILGGVAVAALGFMVLGGDEFSRVRFAVYESGFGPPFSPLSKILQGERAIVPFSLLTRVDSRAYVRSRETRIDEVSLELADGRRFVVREVDVGQEGVKALLKAAEEYRERAIRGEVAFQAPATRVPSWIRKEMMKQLLVIGLAFTVIILFFSALLFLPNLVELSWRILLVSLLLAVLVPVLLAMAYRTWKRAQDLTRKRQVEPSEGSRIGEMDHGSSP